MNSDNDKLIKIAQELADCLNEATAWVEYDDHGFLNRCDQAAEDFENAKALNG